MPLVFADQHYRDLFESIDQGFCTIEVLLDSDGTPVDYRFLNVNAAFAQHTGLENAVGRRIRELVPAHDDHWFRIYGVVALTGVPVRNELGEVIEWIGSATDITARKEAEEALRRSESDHAAARLEAERANIAKDEFLAMVGHELRNPLAPMLTALQLMRLRGINVREQDVLERQVEYLTRMVDDLLDMARITRGKVELRRTALELCAVVVRGVEVVSPLLEQRHHALEVLVPRAGLGVDVDPDRMAQVISNLLANAAKYSERGSTIVVAAARDGEIVRLRIRDHGLGIAPDMLDAIFRPFVQQSQAPGQSIGGLGLGLAIVRSLVEAHGGTVRAESEGLGRGSEMIVELPAVGPEAAHAPAASGAPVAG